MSPSEIKKELAELGIRATKIRGQHFLIDASVLGSIVDAAALTSKDAVLEIGPGLGVLTKELVRRAGCVVAVELDHALAGRLHGHPGGRNLSVLEGDVLQFASRKLVAPCKTEQYKLVANIPYNITSALLEKFLEESPSPQLMVLLVQRELAERVTASAGSMNRLAVFVQYFGRPEIIRIVPRGAFWPAPKVESAILRIRRYPDDVLARRALLLPPTEFFRMVRAGSHAPRRKVVGNLAKGLGLERDMVVRVFQKVGINTDARAEALSLDDWLALAPLLLK